jgi:hypothetical protein
MDLQPSTLLGVSLLVLSIGALGCGGTGRAGIGDDAGTSGSAAPDASATDAPRETASSHPEAGGDGGCDPNIPLSATLVPVNDPKSFKDFAPNQTACPVAGTACTYQDLQINFTTCAGPVDGFRFRYIRPLDASVPDPSHVPAIISEPGSGACWFGESSFDAVDETAATNGAIVLEVAPRGQYLCYLPGDALYHQSDWLGPETLADYDRLLFAFTKGWVDPKLQADPTRLGIHGVSHGGVASFLFGRLSHIPAVTGQPFALVMPELGNPDIASWSINGFDPNDLVGILAGTESATTPWGAMRIDGLVGWEFEYPGAFASSYAAAVAAGDGVPTWAPQFAERSAHDDAAETDVTTFVNNTKHFLGVTATEDCIIPHQGAYDFYQQIQKASGGTDVRLLSPVEYHSCGDTAASLASSLGYLPKVTDANSELMGQWTSSIRSSWISRYLIGIPPKLAGTSLPPSPDPGAGDPSAQPEWMFLLADEGLGTTVPNVYTSSPPGALATTSQTYLLASGTTTINGAVVSLDSATLSYDAETYTELNLVAPAWNESANEEIDIDFPVTTDDFVVIGQPDLTLFVHETSTPAADYSFTVILEDIRPGEPAPWPVGSERRFSHTNTGTPTKQEIKMDTVKSRFKNGDTLRVAITNIALMDPVGGTNTAPMFAPSLNTFTVAFQSSLAGQPSQLVLPTVPYATLTKAPADWQIQE